MEKYQMSDEKPLPVPSSQETRSHTFLFIDIDDTELTDQQLGKAIVTNHEAGLVACGEARDRFVRAGMQLIEARLRVPQFQEFLRDHCNGLSRSRAYELIAIASGKDDEVLAKARARKLRYSQKHAAENAPVRSGTDTRFPPIPLSQEASLDQFENKFVAWLRNLDDATFKRAASCVLRLDNDRNPALDLTASSAQ
jgi:hypothetical protein